MLKNKASKLAPFLAVAVFNMHILLPLTGISQERAAQTDLEANIIGNKEQPNVTYFLPWQRPTKPDTLDWTLDQTHDESLEMVDRLSVMRSMNIYQSAHSTKSESTINRGHSND